MEHAPSAANPYVVSDSPQSRHAAIPRLGPPWQAALLAVTDDCGTQRLHTVSVGVEDSIGDQRLQQFLGKDGRRQRDLLRVADTRLGPSSHE